jgi:glutathione S-transferase
VIKFYRFPKSTNVERVALALAHKRIPAESIEIDPKDRSEVARVSGQELVPVIQDGTRVIHDSMTIVRYLEDAYPDSPRLYPESSSRRAEVEIFVDWFNRVWKRPPNAIVTEMELPETARDHAAIRKWGDAMQGSLRLFESMLTGRDYLMGEFGAADIAAFPFVKYASIPESESDYLFHKICSRYQVLGSDHPNVAAWIARVDARPRT